MFENLILGQTIDDYHSDLRAYSASVLRKSPYNQNSDAFAFDQEVRIQAVAFELRVGDAPFQRTTLKKHRQSTFEGACDTGHLRLVQWYPSSSTNLGYKEIYGS